MGLATLGAHGEVHHPGRRTALGRDRAGREQERRAPDPRRLPAHRGGARGPQRPADSRRRVDARAARAARCERHTDGRTRSACGPTPSSGTEVDEELANRIRASFLVAGPLLARFRRGEDAPSRRGHDRPAPARRPPRRVQGHGRQDRRQGLDRALRAARGPEAEANLHGRALGDGDGERAARGRAHRGADNDRQRRLGAARPGPRATALQDGRPGRRDRLQRDDRPRPRQARRGRARRLLRPHRDRQLHGARRRHQR